MDIGFHQRYAGGIFYRSYADWQKVVYLWVRLSLVVSGESLYISRMGQTDTPSPTDRGTRLAQGSHHLRPSLPSS
jgi:hypothetical protein